MTMAFDPVPYKEVLLFFGTAGLVVPLFHKLKVSPVLGFVAAGVVLGPFGLGRFAGAVPFLSAITISNVDRIAGLAEFGVVFLLFMIGLELSFERLLRMRHLMFGLGFLQVIASTALIGIAAFALGEPPVAAIVIGAALALSSTAIVIPVLAESKRLNTVPGRTSFGVLLLQDLVVAPLIFMVSIIGSGAKEGVAHGLLLALTPAVIALAALIVLGRLVLRPLFQHVAAAHSSELFVAACLLVGIGTGVMTAMSGLPMGLGAFIAGLLLAETEFRREVEVTIEPFKGLLLGLFFVSVGAGLDLSVVVARPLLILALAVALVLLKMLVLIGLCAVLRLPWLVGREVALLLGPGGEFAFVLISAAGITNAVSPLTGRTVAVVVTLTMIAIPVLAAFARRMAQRAPPPDVLEFPPSEGAASVIIAGYGRVGQLVGALLTRHDVPFLAIDTDAHLVSRERETGKAIYYGDPTKPDLLRRCGIEKARGLVVTMNDPLAVENIVATARGERPDLIIIARARDASQAKTLYELGVTDAVPETIEASLQLSEAVLIEIGIPMGHVIASIHEKRDEFRAFLDDASRSGRARRAIRRSTVRGPP
jgi:monovalent cation:H+ antiporter-2, CPA2 family